MRCTMMSDVGYMSSAAVNVGGWCRLAGMEVLVTLHDEDMTRMIKMMVILVLMIMVWYC